MNLTDISRLRILNQQISESRFDKVHQLVEWMGALQSQDYPMSQLAIGLRVPSGKDKDIEKAMTKGEIIRTHVLRPTWHIVSSHDVYWMLELTAPPILSSLIARHKELELTPATVNKALSIFEKSLINHNHLTREELFQLLEKAKISTGAQRGIHLLFHGEMVGLICSGIPQGKQQTYALLEERVTKKKTLQRDEALASLAKRYFLSHGPATIQDFTWWSGLPVKDARKALEMVRTEFESITIGTSTYWFSGTINRSAKTSVYFLPAFDEFIISYKDRTPSLDKAQHSKAVSTNGIFKPVIVVNGKVAGLWKRSIKKDLLIIETDFFEKPEKNLKPSLEKAAEKLGTILNKKVEMKI